MQGEEGNFEPVEEGGPQHSPNMPDRAEEVFRNRRPFSDSHDLLMTFRRMRSFTKQRIVI